MWDFDPNLYNKVYATKNLLYILSHRGDDATVISHDENICIAQVYELPETYPYVLRLRLRRLGSLVGAFDFPPESWDTLMTWFSNSPYPNFRAGQQRALIFNPDNIEKACEVDSAKYFFRFTDRWTYDDPWLWENEWEFVCKNVPSDKIVPSHDF